MDRTLRATLLAAGIAFAVIAGLGMFVGFDPGAAIVAGLVAGGLGGLLIWGAARRADSFHPEPPPVRPGFPGPPDPADEDDQDPR